MTILEVEPGSDIVDGNVVIPSDCKKYNPPDRLSEWQDRKSWMRSPGCVSARNEWTKMGGKDPVNPPSYVTPFCCGECTVEAETVDLYYWPEPDVNRSCLSIVGTDVNPLIYGATTGMSTYWACSLKIPSTSIYTYPGTKPEAAESITSVYSIITTAEISTAGSLPVKISLINPWSSSPFIDPDTSPGGSDNSNSSARIQVRHAVQVRVQSLTIPSSITRMKIQSLTMSQIGVTVKTQQ